MCPCMGIYCITSPCSVSPSGVVWVLRYGEDVIQFVTIANYCMPSQIKEMIVPSFQLAIQCIACTSVHTTVNWPVDDLCWFRWPHALPVLCALVMQSML